MKNLIKSNFIKWEKFVGPEPSGQTLPRPEHVDNRSSKKSNVKPVQYRERKQESNKNSKNYQ